MKRFNYGNLKGILVIKDSHEETEYRMTMPGDVAYVVALLNVSDTALADRDATIAEMREALLELKNAESYSMYESYRARSLAITDAVSKANAILAKYPQKGK